MDDVGRIPSRSSPWAWFPLAVLLAFWVYWAVFDALRIRLDLYLFLPILIGWLASRTGPRLASSLLALGLVTVLSVVERLFPAFSIGFGIPLWIYVLSIFTAMAFARSRWRPLAGVFNTRWRWLRWLAMIAVWLAVFIERDVLWKVSDSFQVGINPGFVLLILVLAASIRWSESSARFRSLFPYNGRTLQKLLTTALVALLVLAFLLYFRLELFNALSLRFGFPSGYALVPVGAFLLAAFAIRDWRLIIVFLTVFFVSDVVLSWLGEILLAVFRSTSDEADGAAFTLEAIRQRFLEGPYFDRAGLTRAVAAAVLGAAMAPFWRNPDPDAVQTGRTTLFLFLTLVVLFFGMPPYSRYLGGTGLMLIGGVAYIMGLRWRVRSLIAGPLLIQMLYLLALVVRCADHSCGASAYELLDIGLVSFPFAFFGLLSNRYRIPPVEAKPARIGARRS